MKYFLILLLLLFCSDSYAQKLNNNPIDDKLWSLVSLKSQYEKWRDMAKESSDTSFSNKRDITYKRYIQMIKTVKNAPEVYLEHINKAIKAGRVEYDGPKRILYNYYNQSLSYLDNDLYFVTRLEAYRVIKRSLFEKNESQLPERTDLYLKKGGKGRIRFTVPPVNIKDTAKFKGDREIH